MRINQLHRSMPTIIRKWGCNWRSLVAMIEEITGKFFDSETLLKMWIECLYAGCFKTEKDGSQKSSVEKPDAVLQITIAHSSRPNLRVYQIGADGTYWAWVRLKRVDWTILKGETANDNEHFRLGNSRGVQIFDPNPEARVVRERSIIYYQSLGVS